MEIGRGRRLNIEDFWYRKKHLPILCSGVTMGGAKENVFTAVCKKTCSDKMMRGQITPAKRSPSDSFGSEIFSNPLSKAQPATWRSIVDGESLEESLSS